MQRRPRARVVVADGHPGGLHALQSLLAQTCHVVASTTDGGVAVEAVVRLSPDLFVIENETSRLGGFQAAARIRAAGLNTRIVVVSDRDDDALVLDALVQGASAFVHKPRVRLDLRAAVEHALAGRTFVPGAGVLPRWARPDGSRHDLQIYETDALLIDTVIELFDAALDVGDSIVAIANEPHLQAIEERMRLKALDVESLAAAGRYSVMNAEAALASVCRDGAPDAALFAAALDPLLARGIDAATGARPHVTLFGEIAPILCARGEFEAMLRLEGIADAFAASRPVSILCGYSTVGLGEAVPSIEPRICAHHATIVGQAAGEA